MSQIEIFKEDNFLILAKESKETLLNALQTYDPMYYLPVFDECDQESLAHRLVLWNCMRLDEYSLENRMLMARSFLAIHQSLIVESVRNTFRTRPKKEIDEFIIWCCRHEVPWSQYPKATAYRMTKALKKAFKTVKSNIHQRVSSTYHKAYQGARNIGIRAHEKAKAMIRSLLDFISSSVGDTYTFIIDFIRSRLDSLYDMIMSSYITIREKINSAEALAAIVVGFTISLLAMALPSGALGWYSRFALIAIGLVVAYFQNMYATAAGAALSYVLATVKRCNIFSHDEKMKFQNETMSRDISEWISSTVCTTTLLSMCVAGLDIPTEKKSLDEMLKRHALLGRAQQTWSMVGDKIVEYISDSTRLVYKYILKKEYISFSHVPEVDRLFAEVAEMVKIENASNVQRDQEAISKIESMYLRYMHFRRVYANNKKILQSIEQMGPPIIHLYKEVSHHNPKGYLMRKEPVCMMIKGEPGVGKSFLMSVLQQDLLKIAGKYVTENDLEGKIYSRAHEQEYWDGYVGQPIVIFDDFGQMKDSQANPNPEFFEILRTVNTFPYQLHSAALEQKGNNPFEADFICLTTNLTDINPASLISSEAIKRRIHIEYTLELRKEVRNSLGRLDKVALAKYREAHGLDVDDTSHWIFKTPGGTAHSYDDVVVHISRVYKAKAHTFEVQKDIAQKSKTKKLPVGAYSVDPDRWLLQGEEMTSSTSSDISIEAIPLPVFLNASRSTQQDILSHKSVMYTPNFPLSPELETTTFEDYTTLLQFVSASPECKLYLSHRQATQVKPQICVKMFKEEDPKKREEIKKEIEGLADDLAEAREKAEKMTMRWQKFAYALSGYRYWYEATASKWENLCYFLVFLMRTIAVIAMVYKLVDWVKTIFPSTYSKEILMKYLKYKIVIDCAANLTDYPFIHPFKYSGYSTLAGVILAVSTHYLQHRMYEKSCSECVAHKSLHEQVDVEELKTVKDKDLSFADIHEMIERMKKDPTGENPFLPEDDPSHGKVSARTSKKMKYETDEAPAQKKTLKTENDTAILKKVKVEQMNLKNLFPGLKMECEGPSSAQAIELGRALRANMYHLSVEYDGLKCPIGTVFCLKGHKAIINYHYYQTMSVLWENCVDKDSFMCCITQHEHTKGVYCTLASLVEGAFPIQRGEVVTEFYMITLPKACPLGKDIAKKHLITTADFNKLSRGVRLIMFTYVREGDHFVRTVRDGTFVELFTAAVVDKRNPEVTHCYPYSVKYDMQTAAGDCGSPIVIGSDEFSHKLLGFHFAGISGFGACSVITYSDVEPYLRYESASAEPVLVTPQGEEPSPFPMKDSSFRFIGTTKFPPVVQPCKTAFRKSLLYGMLGPSTVAPARLRPALEPEGPMLKGLMKNAGPVYPLNPFLVAEAVQSYENRINIYAAHDVEIRVLNFEEACRGIPGNKYFPPLKRSKSAGFPLMFEARKGKTDWLGTDDWTFDTPECRMLKNQVHAMEDQCRNGIVPECYFVDTLKDEKRTLEKVAAGKTRVFSAAPLAFSILCRKYMMGFIGFVSRTRIGNECAVGTNVYSEDWKNIVDHLKCFGKQTLIAGDFENFDGTTAFPLFVEIVQIMNRFYGDSTQNQRVRSILWEVICKSPHIISNLAYYFSHGQPSGNPTTAVTNSVYNSLAVRYCYGLLGLSVAHFNENVRMVAYGDDNLISVHPAIQHIVNPVTLSEAFTKIGMKYTSEDKESQIASFRSFDEVTFLKRKFAYDKDLDWWFAPLSLPSVIESLNWVKKSCSDLEATIVNCEDAQDEMFHHDEETFNEVYGKIQSALRTFGYRVSWKPWKIGRTQVALQQDSFIGDDKRYI